MRKRNEEIERERKRIETEAAEARQRVEEDARRRIEEEQRKRKELEEQMKRQTLRMKENPVLQVSNFFFSFFHHWGLVL